MYNSKKNGFLQETRRREKERARSSYVSQYSNIHNNAISSMLDSLEMMAKFSEYDNFFVHRKVKGREFKCVVDYAYTRSLYARLQPYAEIEFKQFNHGKQALIKTDIVPSEEIVSYIKESKYFDIKKISYDGRPDIDIDFDSYRKEYLINISNLIVALNTGELSSLLMMLIEYYYKTKEKIEDDIYASSQGIGAGMTSVGSLINGMGKTGFLNALRLAEAHIRNTNTQHAYRTLKNRKIESMVSNPCNEIYYP